MGRGGVLRGRGKSQCIGRGSEATEGVGGGAGMGRYGRRRGVEGEEGQGEVDMGRRMLEGVGMRDSRHGDGKLGGGGEGGM
jgi:hypothetical protein